MALVQGCRNNTGVYDATKSLFSAHLDSWEISTTLYHVFIYMSREGAEEDHPVRSSSLTGMEVPTWETFS